MVIVSDTSIITNLIQVDHLEFLQDIFGEIVIPAQVFEELSKVPGQLEIIENTEWIEVKTIANEKQLEELTVVLDPGEAEAIVLALELKADALLIDEKKGRKIAQKYGIVVTGLLGILISAKEENLIPEIKPILDKLIFEIGFRINPKLYQQILKRVDETAV
ncbi:MAG: DUF3368 domain-containing protein [Bacteroidota bacterium]